MQSFLRGARGLGGDTEDGRKHVRVGRDLGKGGMG